MSATCLLERYIEDSGSGSILAKPCIFPPPADIALFDYNTVKEYIRTLHWSGTPTASNKVNMNPSPELKSIDEISESESIPTTDSTDMECELDNDELAQYYLIRSQRRKKGTLRVKNQLN